MATVKIVLDKREKHRHKDGRYALVLRLGHKSQTRDISLGYYVFEQEFYGQLGNYKITGLQNSVRKSKRIQKLYSDIDLWMDEKKAEIKLWSIGKLKDVVERNFFKKQSTIHLLEHSCELFNRKRLKEKFSTISSYEDALKIFVKYNRHLKGGSDKQTIKTLFSWESVKGYQVLDTYKPFDMPIKAIDKDYAKKFHAYLYNRYASKNSVNIHLRSLQAIISDAETSFEELKDHRPLKGIKKKSFANQPVDLTIEEIDKIRKFKKHYEPSNPKFDSINYFLFMFNNMGMNFADIALAKVGWFDGERFSYTRKKTEEEGEDHFSILQNPENVAIINHYKKGKKANEYLFPIIPEGTSKDEIFKKRKHKLHQFNAHFKVIGKQLEIDKKITTYTPRDTWTNIGLGLGVDLRKISKGLGHANIQTTQKHYERSVQSKILDEINKIIIGNASSL